jgi:hypothetical protein
VAAIDYSRELDSIVTFSQPGVYAFELRVGDAVDAVTIEVLGEEEPGRAVGWRAVPTGDELRFFPGPSVDRALEWAASGRPELSADGTLAVLAARGLAFESRAARLAPRLRPPFWAAVRGELAGLPLPRAVRATTWVGHSLELQLWGRSLAHECSAPPPLAGPRVATAR